MAELDVDPDLETATIAMRHWIAGAATGDWSPLIALLDPDVTFHVPVEGLSGVRHGRAAATEFFDRLTADLRADLSVTSTMRAGPRIAYEVTVRGSMRHTAFVQALCLVFLVGSGRVWAFHEYLAWPGGLDPAESTFEAVAA